MLPLRPTPNSKRPLLIWSTVAASSAMRKGWIRGNTWTAMPTRKRLVRVAIEQATIMGAESTERLGLKCISPNHTVSSPAASAMSTSRKDSSNVSSGVSPERRTKSRNMPKYILCLLLCPGVCSLRLLYSIDLQGNEGKSCALRPASQPGNMLGQLHHPLGPIEQDRTAIRDALGGQRHVEDSRNAVFPRYNSAMGQITTGLHD